jgi:hypothetical protein
MSNEFPNDRDRELAAALASSRPADVPGAEHRGLLGRELSARALAAGQSDSQIWSAQRYLVACAVVTTLGAIIAPLGMSWARPQHVPHSDLPREFAALYQPSRPELSIDWKAEFAALPKSVPVLLPRIVKAQRTGHQDGDWELKTLREGGM